MGQQISDLRFDLDEKTKNLERVRQRLKEAEEKLGSTTRHAEVDDEKFKELMENMEKAAGVFLEHGYLHEEEDRAAMERMFFGRMSMSQTVAGISTHSAAKSLATLSSFIESMVGFDTVSRYMAMSNDLQEQINDMSNRANELLGTSWGTGWAFPVLRKGELDQDEVKKSIELKYEDERARGQQARRPSFYKISEICDGELDLLVRNSFEVVDDAVKQPARGKRIMVMRSYDLPGAPGGPLLKHPGGTVQLVENHQEFQRVEREYGRGALQAVQKALLERQGSDLASGGYSQAYVYNFKEKRKMKPLEIVDHMAGLVAGPGHMTCTLEVEMLDGTLVPVQMYTLAKVKELRTQIAKDALASHPGKAKQMMGAQVVLSPKAFLYHLVGDQWNKLGLYNGSVQSDHTLADCKVTHGAGIEDYYNNDGERCIRRKTIRLKLMVDGGVGR